MITQALLPLAEDSSSFTVKPSLGLILWALLALLILVGLVAAVVIALRSR